MNVRIVLVVCFLVISSSGSYAGAWTQGKGSGFLQFSFTYLNYQGLINRPEPNSKLKREISDFTVQAYLEYGLSDRLTLVGTVPYKLLEAGNELLSINPEDDLFPQDTTDAGTLNGFSNITLGLKYLLMNKKYVLSAQLRGGSNTQKYDDATGLRTGYDSWLVTPSLLLGRGFDKAYFTAEAGFQFKTNGYADNVIASIEYGLRIDWKNTKTWIAAVLDANVPVNVGEFDDRNSVHTGLFQDGEGYISPGVKVNHYLGPKLSVNLASYGAFWADHGGNEPTINLGLALEW